MFSDVLLLCKEAGLTSVGVIAIDGTKIHANTSHHSNLDYEHLAREILKEAGEVDRAEDELYGDTRGDELPEHLRTPEGVVPRYSGPRRSSSASAQERKPRSPRATDVESRDPEIGLDPVAIVARMKGREGWVREARSQLEEHRRVAGTPIPRSRVKRLLEAERRLQENLSVEREANEAYEEHRATGVTRDGRRFGARPNPYVAPEVAPGKD